MKRIFLCLGFVLTVFSASGAVLYVRGDAAGSETNGLSWATAFNTITEALQHSVSGDELWVAAGTYVGSIEVRPGIALYGGFAGTETSRVQRDWSRNTSIIDWNEWGDFFSRHYNTRFRHAVSLGTGSQLDGFTVINGWYAYGAGIYAGSAAIIANNIVLTNRATGILAGTVLVDRPGQFNLDNDFFLKTANDLLHLQFPFGATNIPVSQYGPAVHRLIQVAANIYDAVHSNAFPSVFRPQFSSTSNGPIISGYYNDDSADTVVAWLSTNHYGIPMIIGARKGFPNFNEFVLETVVSAARRLEVRRQTTNSRPHQTNEMYVLGIENRFGLEAWNSYTNCYSNRLDLSIANHFTISITNIHGLILSTSHVFSVATNYETWPGFVKSDDPWFPYNSLSFKIPLQRNTISLSNAIYRAGSPGWIEPVADANNFVPNSGFHVPEWTLSTSNDLVFVLQSGGRIVDFVHLILTNSFGLSSNLFDVSTSLYEDGPVALCWSTNRRGNAVYVPTEGVQQQIDISLGQVGGVGPWHWAEYSNVNDPGPAITNFRSFMFPETAIGDTNTNLIQQVPFTPTRKRSISARFEANDPLVHTLPEHLTDVRSNYVWRMLKPFAGSPLVNSSLFTVNSRYSPWGGRLGQISRADDVDWRIKDAGIRNASSFDFPDDPHVNVDWLDHVHRGTPWQTLYFDGDIVPMDVWLRQLADAATHPTNDWRVIEHLRGQLTYSGSPTPTRVMNNTIVGNKGGVWIASNASASIMNNAVVYNTSGIVEEGGSLVELSNNCVSCSSQFVNPVAGDFSVTATSPLIDAGNDEVLNWIDRPRLGPSVDIGALEFGPEGVPAFTFQRTSQSEYELLLRGFDGQSYVVEASTNLLNWTPISTNVAAMGKIVLQDAAGTNCTHRFYRAKVANHPN